MTGIQKVRTWFRSGRLVRPSSDTLNFVDLTRALALLAGAKGFPSGTGVETLCRMIGPAEHYVFVLVDGLGVHQLDRLPKEAFLRSAHAATLQSVFLSTTASALTTLATGQWPCSHGVPGWWTYLEEQGVSAVTLPFKERSTEIPLENLGIAVTDVFPVPSFWPALRKRPLSIVPRNIAGTIYSGYISGGTPRVGYAHWAGAFETARDAVLTASGPGLVYVYLPQLDTLCHKRGTQDKRVHDLLQALDRSLFRFCSSLKGRARILISSDHGQADVPGERRYVLSEDDSILTRLRGLPSGEPGVPIFHVRQGREAQFRKAFDDRFGEAFALLTPEEVEDLRLLGPTVFSKKTKDRLGTFVGIAREPAAICVGPPAHSGAQNIGFHGGLSGAEMRVPLIIP